MKKVILFILVICILCCGNVFAANEYKIINMAEFPDVGILSEGLCAVKDNATQRWGVVDTNKNWVVTPQYKSVSYFKNGLCAAVTVDNEGVLIDREGRIVFHLYKDASYIDSENYFLEKYNGQNIIWQNTNKGSGNYIITLVDKDFNPIISQEKTLYTFSATTTAPDISHTFFTTTFASSLYGAEDVYNYKGINLTNKVVSENSIPILANNKYLLCLNKDESNILVFDVDGTKIAEFYSATTDNRNIGLKDDFITIDGNYIHTTIYNIPSGKKVYESTETGYTDTKTYYNKYFTVKKQSGTSALYSYGGEVLVNYGKWDYIYPSSISNYIVVANSSKYGIADYAGNLVLPLEYSATLGAIVDETGRYASLKKSNSYYYFNLSSLITYQHSTTWDAIGNKYLIRGNNAIDNNFNIVYSLYDGYKFHDKNYLDSGVIRLYRTINNNREYAFLSFNDDGGIKVNLDGRKIAFDQLPIIQNGRTLVPMRAIFEALGASVEWNGETQSIKAQKGNTTIQMQIGKNNIIKNGENITIDVAPKIVGGRTLVPVRAISDCLNVAVDWDNYTQTVYLFTN